jgi:hypothetical protein
VPRCYALPLRDLLRTIGFGRLETSIAPQASEIVAGYWALKRVYLLVLKIIGRHRRLHVGVRRSWMPEGSARHARLCRAQHHHHKCIPILALRLCIR